jgi:hypothetical protein
LTAGGCIGRPALGWRSLRLLMRFLIPIVSCWGLAILLMAWRMPFFLPLRTFLVKRSALFTIEFVASLAARGKLGRDIGAIEGLSAGGMAFSMVSLPRHRLIKCWKSLR